MADSLERPFANTPRHLLDCRIESATEWIRHAALPLFEFMRQGASTGSEQRALGSICFRGEMARSQQRWKFWKLRFEIVRQLDVAYDISTCALDAVSKMEDAEKEGEHVHGCPGIYIGGY